MEAQQESSVPTFDNLPATQPISEQLVAQMDALIHGNWADSFHCITALRSINKFYPENVTDVVNRYLPALCDLISSGKTQVVKNAFSLIREVFSRGKMLNVEKCVFAFSGILIKKAATQHGHVQKMAKEALEEFVNNCGYDISFVIVSEYSVDKNASISEVSIKLMAKLIQNLGGAIAQLKPETLQKVMKSLTFLLDGKRPNAKNWGVEICMYIYGLIGNQNYYNLMMFVLSPEEVQLMSTAMSKKDSKGQKQQVPHLSTVLKERKSMLKQQKQTGLMSYHNNDQNTNFNQQQQVFQNGTDVNFPTGGSNYFR